MILNQFTYLKPVSGRPISNYPSNYIHASEVNIYFQLKQPSCSEKFPVSSRLLPCHTNEPISEQNMPCREKPSRCNFVPSAAISFHITPNAVLSNLSKMTPICVIPADQQTDKLRYHISIPYFEI